MGSAAIAYCMLCPYNDDEMHHKDQTVDWLQESVDKLKLEEIEMRIDISQLTLLCLC